MKKMLETAKEVLGYDLLELCNEGPKEKLDNTVYSQVGCNFSVFCFSFKTLSSSVQCAGIGMEPALLGRSCTRRGGAEVALKLCWRGPHPALYQPVAETGHRLSLPTHTHAACTVCGGTGRRGAPALPERRRRGRLRRLRRPVSGRVLGAGVWRRPEL